MTEQHPISTVRIEYGHDGQPPMTREAMIFVARQLVRDLPGVVVAEVPKPAHVIGPFDIGWNAAIAAMLKQKDTTP